MIDIININVTEPLIEDSKKESALEPKTLMARLKLEPLTNEGSKNAKRKRKAQEEEEVKISWF